ncbi:MAG TPA: hypothetical protein PLE45_04540 [Spirochaetota bacterium]|nr:hypothetical protein [Spirochaetota bacterium]
MKRSIIILLLLLAPTLIFSKNRDISILIVPLKNASLSEEEDYIRYMLYDTAFNFFKERENFIIDDTFDKIELGISKEDDIIKNAKFKNISIILTGFFIKIDNTTKVTVKVINVKKEKSLIVKEFINKDLNTLQGDFLNTLKLIEKEILEKNLTDKKEIINENNFISNLVSEEFLFFKIGISYSLFYHNILNKDVTNDYDISSVKNNYQNSITYHYNLEYYKLYKDNFYGFGVGLSIPFEINAPKFFNNAYLNFSFVFGYRKKFFFKWTVDTIFLFFKIYSSNLDKPKDSYNIDNVNIGPGFNFRYLDDKYNLYIETGFTFIPFLFGFTSQEKYKSPINKIVIRDDINNNSIIVPVLLNFEIGKFLNNEVGLFVMTRLGFYYLDYTSRFYRNWTNNGDYQYQWDFGDSFSINITIIAGATFKTLYK